MVNYNNFKDLTEAIKNVVTLISYLFVVSIVIYFFPWLKENMEFDAIQTPFGNFKRKEVSKALNSVVSNEGKKDISVAPGLEQVAQIVDSINVFTKGYWVYIGQVANGEFIDQNLKFQKMPKKGDCLPTNTALYKRKFAPHKTSSSWILGEIIGVLKEGEKACIDSIIQIEDQNYWALVH